MMSALTIFIGRGRHRRKKQSEAVLHVWGPTIVAAVATCLIMADLTRHCLQDLNVWPSHIFFGMKESDIVVGLTLPDGDAAAGASMLRTYYAPENGVLEENEELSLLGDKNFTVADGQISMCFTRQIDAGHHTLSDQFTYPMFSIGYHDGTGSTIGLKHTGDPMDRGVVSSDVDFTQSSKKPVTLTEDASLRNVTLTWVVRGENVEICTTAKGPGLSDENYLGFGFTKPLGVGSSQYILNFPKCTHENDERMACLSTVGIVFTIFLTYTGFILLAVSTMWNADIVKKVKTFREKWKEIRARQ